MPKDSCEEYLAEECVRGRLELRRAAQVLHDDAGSLLAVAGLRLQLLCMDFPETATRAAEISEALDGVMEHLRVLSRRLEPSPVRRTGLKNALLDLAESRMVSSDARKGVSMVLRYTATATLPPEIADAMYHAIASAVAAAGKNVRRIAISVSGSRTMAARVSHDGEYQGRAVAAAALLARHAGLTFEVATEKGTIVSIRYAIRRPSGG
jgi:signal transduction histidine kinase